MSLRADETSADDPSPDSSLHIPPDHITGRMPPGPTISDFSQSYPQPEEVHLSADEAGCQDDRGLHHSSPARVPIPPQHSAQPPPTTPPSGPMSSSVVIPPRPRPGRKPIPQEDAADRRRLQNRIAQRNFRDKRQQKLVETQVELEDRRKQYQGRVNELERQLEEVRQEGRDRLVQIQQDNAQLSKRLQDAEQRAQQAEAQLQESVKQQQSARARDSILSASITTPHPPPRLSLDVRHPPPVGTYGAASVPTPPEDGYEIDFTNFFRPAGNTNHGLRPVAHDSGPAPMMGDVSMDLDDRCGFCTDEQNCACRQETQQTVPARTQPGPGNCAACRADPERAQACRDLARQTSIAGPGAGGGGGGATSADLRTYDGRPSILSGGRMSCASMLDRVGGRHGERLASIAELFAGQPLLAYPPAPGAAGYEIEAREAARVLQHLSARPGAGPAVAAATGGRSRARPQRRSPAPGPGS